MAARDEGAFEAFVSARSGDLLRTAMLLTHDRGHAEDLLQAALVKAYRRWRRIAAEDPYPYAQEIVSLPADVRWVTDATEAVAERERLIQALASLPPRMRTVLVLRYAEDLSEAATADAMGCSVATVKTHAARGLARLRAVLVTAEPSALLEEC
jgi:RNA polymerase sigma-70 factor (sigma-E family)